MLQRTVLLLLLWSFLSLIAVFAQEKPSHGYLVASDEVKTHYVVLGRGTPVILIHGLGGNAEKNWFDNGIAQALAKNHRVIAIDLRGHGLSDKPHDPARYGEHIWKDVIEIMDHLAVKRAHIHGYSIGGEVLIQLLAQYPERFISAIFGGSGVRETDSQWKAKVPEDKAGVDPQDAEAKRIAMALPGRDQMAIDAFLQSKESFFKGSLDLTKTTIPVLAINGEFDKPNAKTYRMQRELKNFKSVILPGKSHLTAIFPGYMPELYLTSLVSFINANDIKDNCF